MVTALPENQGVRLWFKGFHPMVYNRGFQTASLGSPGSSGNQSGEPWKSCEKPATLHNVLYSIVALQWLKPQPMAEGLDCFLKMTLDSS